MFRDQDSLYEHRNLFIWFILAFQGGAINAGGFLAVHRFVSHVTGFPTFAGIAGAEHKWDVMFGMLLVPIFFICGALLSAWLVERRRIKELAPKYSMVFTIIILLLSFVAICGSLKFFGTFGEPLSNSRDYFLLFLLSFTCGLQNAVISSASGSVIRTTHLTGITTDFSIGLVRIWTNRNKLEKREVFANWCRFGIFVSFFLGSLLSAMIYNRFQFFGFFLPVSTSIFVAIRLRSPRN